MSRLFWSFGPNRRDRVSLGLIVRKRGQRETFVVWTSRSYNEATRDKDRPTRPVPDRAIRVEDAAMRNRNPEKQDATSPVRVNVARAR